MSKYIIYLNFFVLIFFSRNGYLGDIMSIVETNITINNWFCFNITFVSNSRVIGNYPVFSDYPISLIFIGFVFKKVIFQSRALSFIYSKLDCSFFLYNCTFSQIQSDYSTKNILYTKLKIIEAFSLLQIRESKTLIIVNIFFDSATILDRMIYLDIFL